MGEFQHYLYHVFTGCRCKCFVVAARFAKLYFVFFLLTDMNDTQLTIIFLCNTLVVL